MCSGIGKCFQPLLLKLSHKNVIFLCNEFIDKIGYYKPIFDNFSTNINVLTKLTIEL